MNQSSSRFIHPVYAGENSQFQFSTESPGNAKRGRPSSEAQSLQLPADNITTAAKMSKADPLERPTNNTPSFTFNATPASKTETASASLPGISATQFSFGATNQASNGAENPANVPSAPVFNFNARDTVPAANAGKVSDSFKIENRATTANTEASKSSTAGTPFVFGQTPSATGIFLYFALNVTMQGTRNPMWSCVITQMLTQYIYFFGQCRTRNSRQDSHTIVFVTIGSGPTPLTHPSQVTRHNCCNSRICVLDKILKFEKQVTC